MYIFHVILMSNEDGFSVSEYMWDVPAAEAKGDLTVATPQVRFIVDDKSHIHKYICRHASIRLTGAQGARRGTCENVQKNLWRVPLCGNN